MRSYFFVPATKLSKIPTIISLGVSEIIIDFEDAVLQDQKESLLNQVKYTNGFEKLWYRIPLRNDYTDTPNIDFLTKVLNFGITKVVLPKLISKEEVKVVIEEISVFESLKIILLIEHPRLLIEVVNVLQDTNLSGYISGLGLGSHDLTTFLDIKHAPNQLNYPRTKLIYLAKAYGKEAIDIAEMNISKKSNFENELLFGAENGYDAKFLIHPIQIRWLREFQGTKMEQISWAKKIIAALPEGHTGKEIEPFVLDGEIIEKPHVEKARLILMKFED